MIVHKGAALVVERKNEEKTSLEEKIEGASERIQNGEKKDNLPSRGIKEEKETVKEGALSKGMDRGGRD